MTRHAVPVILLLSTVLLPACGGSDEGSETFGVNLGNIAQARQNYIDSRSRLATAGIGIVKTHGRQYSASRSLCVLHDVGFRCKTGSWTWVAVLPVCRHVLDAALGFAKLCGLRLRRLALMLRTRVEQ
jgi:hypothetical protein